VSALRAALRRLAAMAAADRSDRDFADELESHLQLHVDDNLRAGMSPAEARRRAIIALGGVEATKERYRDRRGVPALDALRQDVGYAARTFRRAPGFAAVATLTLALGIGAATAIFSVVNAVLLRPLPFRDSDRLVMVYSDGEGDDRHDVVSYPTFVDWRDRSRSFAAAAAFVNRTMTADGGPQAELIRGTLVTASFFTVLGVQPAIGGTFQPDDDRDPPTRAVVLSDGFWRRHFGAMPDAIGATLRLSDGAYTVIGVMPPEFRLEPIDGEQIYLPLPIDVNRRHGFLRIVARLRPGLSADHARADLDAVAAHLTRVYPRNEARRSVVVPLVDALAGPSRPALLILFAIVTLLLMISCANVAGLLLARGAARQRELAVRAALGATRGRIARQLLTESVLFAFAGGGAGLVLAGWLARVLVRIVSAAFSVPRLDTTHTDFTVFAFALLVSIGMGIVFGVLPAWASASPDVNRSLRESAHTGSSLRVPRLGGALVIAQTALALVLLAAAAVLANTLVTLRATRPGFDTRRLLAFDLWLPPAHFPRLDERARFVEDTLRRVGALPGVRSAALVADLPLGGSTDSQSFHIVGRPDPASDRAFNSGFNVVSTGYFATMGIPIREGREFGDGDGRSSPGVAIVNETAARRFWPDRSPLGARIDLPIARGRSTLLTVVGVAGDVRHVGLAEPPRPEIFLDSLQSELSWPAVVLAVRTAADPISLAAPITSALREVDPNVPLMRVRTMDEILASAIAEPRLFALLLGAFASVALTLAAVGLSGLISYTVTQRAREMSIRLALGASRGDVLRMVLAQGVRLAGAGALLGAAGGLAATRLLVALIKGATANDSATLATASGVLLTTALLATYLPARRAARADPAIALRAD
jgi:putative ABC transport system permease protein